MLSNNIFVRFVFILMISSSLGLAQRSDLVSSSSIDGQIVRYGGLKEPVLVLLGSFGLYEGSTDIHEFTREFRIPQRP